jgi:hypothetical protein
MMKMNPTFLEENGKRKFVVFSMKEYKAIREALEDAYDVHLIEESKRRSAGRPSVSHEQMLRELGLTHLLTNGKKRRRARATPSIRTDRRTAKVA